ncbi:MAG: PAS domain S-box protein, partial [Lachnospiraceae bacterium]|nr:PAS domain S-box protein [Lachnospiraceae bacterium]
MFESAFSIISTIICLGFLGSLLVLFFQYQKQKIKAADSLRRARAARRRFNRVMHDKQQAEEAGIKVRNALAAMMTDQYNMFLKVEIQTGRFWHISAPDSAYTEILGIGDWPSLVHAFVNTLHPHDVEAVRKFYLETVPQLEPGDVASIAFKTRLHTETMTEDDTYEWDSSNVHVVNEGGQTVAYILNRNETDVVENELRAKKLNKENRVLKELRDSLAEKNKEMTTILSSMPGGFALMECGGRFTFRYVREELPRLLGYTVDEFLRESKGNALGAIVEEDRTDAARRMRDALDRGEEGFTIRLYMNCKGGGRKLLSMNARVMQDESDTRMIYAFYIDITKEQETSELIAMQQKIVEEERGNKVLLQEVLNKERRYKLKLEEALLNAEKANEAKSHFLNSMSHDIRTPLNAILGFATLARKDPSDGGKVDYALDKIELSGRHLLSLINDVLDMSKIESGAVTLTPETHSIGQIMEELEIMLGQEAKKHDLSLQFETDVVHDLVTVDVLRINQILLNIGSNAVKYTEPGGRVTIRVFEDTTKGSDGLSHLTFSCKDTGIGMDEEFVEHVFDAFSRERTSTISGIQGTGLGMAITKRLVEMMGGTITAKSRKGEGSEYIVSLQLPIVEAEDASGKEEMGAYDLTGIKVLLVEDNELNREIAEEFLKDAGLTVDTAEDG